MLKQPDSETQSLKRILDTLPGTVRCYSGTSAQPIRRILLIPELCPADLDAARAADLVLSAAPLTRRPLFQLDPQGWPAAALRQAEEKQVALASLNVLPDSFSSWAPFLDLHTRPKEHAADRFRLVVFVPATHEQVILDTLFASPAGRIGAYSGCTFRTPGIGTFLPDETAHPAIGRANEITQVQELKIECEINSTDLDQVIGQIQSVHPYETMAWYAHPILKQMVQSAELEQPRTLKDWVQQLETIWGCGISCSGDPARWVQRIGWSTNPCPGTASAPPDPQCDAWLSRQPVPPDHHPSACAWLVVPDLEPLQLFRIISTKISKYDTIRNIEILTRHEAHQ